MDIRPAQESQPLPTPNQPQQPASTNPVPSVPPMPPPQAPHKSRNVWKFLIFFFLVILIGVCVLTYLSYNTYQEQQHVTTQQNASSPHPSNKIAIGMDATFAPMEYIDEKGQFSGYDVDLGSRIAKDLGVQVEFKHYTWVKLFEALQDKKIDAIMSSVSITDERKKIYLFSDPYLNAGQVIITLKTNTKILKPEDLKGLKVGVNPGTTNEIEAKKYTDPENVVANPLNDELVTQLKNGTIQAMIQDLSGAKGIVDANPEFKIAGDPFTIENYGVVFRKDETELVQKVNAILTQLREKGVLDDIKQKWFD